MPLEFAAIADDFTGGSDLAGMLFEQGVRTVQLFGTAGALSVCAGMQAVVLSLKSRSVSPERAVAMTLNALSALRRLEPRQIQFKYCSTFDSTERGNIGPVTEALLTALDAPFTIAVPALPVNGRTQYLGHLFVQGTLLSESPMRDHPLNPMTDSNLVRFLQKQTAVRVGLIDLATLRRGDMRAAADRLRAEGVRIALVDAIEESDLALIADVCHNIPLITGGSGLARHLPRYWTLQSRNPVPLTVRERRTVILAGSCSAATLNQLERYPGPKFRLDSASAFDDARNALAAGEAPVIASSATESDRDPGAAERIERCFGELARRAVAELGISDLIVAGGETSGAVVEALGIIAAEVTGIVAAGVPSLRTLGDPSVRLVLKSGNFGGPDFFADALKHLEHR